MGPGGTMNTTQDPAPALTPSLTGRLRASRPALAADVAAAFHAALDKGAAIDELRVSTRAFVGMWKAEGFPPEKVLVSLKEILAVEASCISLAPVCCTSHAPTTRGQRIYEQVFGWYLDAYYRDGQLPGELSSR